MSDPTIMPPDLDDVLLELKNEIFATMNCIQIGKIEKVNSNQTVEIMLQVKRRISGDKTADYPLLVDCPYFVLQGGGAYIDMPIKAGDYCLVLFNDRNIDNWWSTENVKEPADRRKHNLSDGLALVGINSSINSLAADGGKLRILGPSGPGAEQPASRTGDAIQSTAADDSTFWTWITAAGAALAALGVIVPIPSSLTGKITGGSSEVEIG